MVKCSVHPKYKGTGKPKETEKCPKGCPACWLVYANREAEKRGHNLNYEETVGLGSLDSASNLLNLTRGGIKWLRS